MHALALAIVVIAHRGEHLHHPENTLPAFQRAIDLGCDFIEVDVRTTADGKLMLMHNATVDSRTNGSGPVKEMTSAQLLALDAGVKFDAKFAGTKIPYFDEALALAKGKIGIYVDVKDASARALLDAFDRHGMREKVVIYGGFNLLAELARLAPEIKVMPESVSTAALEKNIPLMKPRVIAFSESDFKDEIVAVAKAAKAEIYLDRLGKQDTPAFWEDAVKRGATGIQTDHPAELIEFLKQRGWR